MKTLDPLQPNYRILVVDDNEGIHQDLRKVLAGSSPKEVALSERESSLFDHTRLPISRFEVDSAYQGQEALVKLNQSIVEDRPYAVAFVDIRMPPGWDGIETVSYLWKACPELQVVICTAYSDYSWDQMIRRIGHSDNLIILKKPFENIVVLQIAHALTRKWQVTRQAQLRLEDLDRLVSERTRSLQAANERLLLSERRFATAFGASPIPLALQDGADGRFVDANDRFLDITGYRHADLVGHTPTEIKLWPEETDDTAWINPAAGALGLREFACQFRTKNGEIREALVSTEALQIGEGTHRLLILQDISDRVRLENRLRQAQKLEAVGQLAGGIAHDFNNVLAVILGNLSIAEMEVTPDSEAHQALKEAALGAQRAKELTTQLLTFSMGGKPVKKSVALEQIIRDAATVTLRGSAIPCRIRTAPDLWPVQADAAQLGQVFNNLLLNAQQAMAAGGEIRIELTNQTISPADGHPMKEGPYVHITVQDQGHGIAPENVARIFDPYFTTKKTGNGLGLAVVYSVIKNHYGNITVESTPDAGTKFSLLLPASEPKNPTNGATTTPLESAAKKRILVMDDEEMVRRLLSNMLHKLGSEVVLTEDGAAALKAYSESKANSCPFDLVIMDLTVQRGMGGQEAIQRLLEFDPNVKAVVSSGYSDNPIMADYRAHGFCGVINKPYTLAQLTAVLRSVLSP